MKKVLIFGCAGFVGEYLAKEWKEYGYQVIGTDLVSAKKETMQWVDDYEILDILDAEKIIKLIQTYMPDYIINLAAVSSVGASWNIPQQTMEVNVNGTLNILEAVRQCKKDAKILLVGSSEEYMVSSTKITENHPINANNPYGISKVTQEHFAELYRLEYGLKIITTRTFNHTGVGQTDTFAIPSFVKQAAEIEKSGKEGVIVVGNLSAHRDLGDVRDMVAAYRMILESDTIHTVFNVGSGQCYRLNDILSYIISHSSRKIEIKVDTARLRPLDNPVIWCDNHLLREEIGWSPRYTIYDAIDRMYQHEMEKQ